MPVTEPVRRWRLQSCLRAITTLRWLCYAMQLWRATLSNEHHRVKVNVMLKRIIGIILGVLAVALLNAIVSQSQDGEIAEQNLNTPVVTAAPVEIKPPCERPKEQIPADTVISRFDRLTHHDYPRIGSDMRGVLKAHPVYRYIYKQTANR